MSRQIPITDALRSTWPESGDFGLITAGQRRLAREAADHIESQASLLNMLREALELAEAHFAGEPFDPSARKCLTATREALATLKSQEK